MKLALRLVAGAWACLAATSTAETPRLFYVDLESGPGTGGEGNAGAFVTLHGRAFGATRGSSTVTVGGGAVATYRSWNDRRIVVQLGAAAATGNVLVTSAAGTSNGLPFSVRPGNIYFVATTGDDGGPGTFASPWRTIVKAKDTIAAGDIVYVMDGVAQTAEDNYGAALSIETSGLAGQPKAVVAYPGATVTVGDTTPGRMGIRVPNIGISADHWVFAGLRLRGEVNAVEIGGSGSQRWRVVDNDISCPVGDGQTGCFAAALASYVAFLGNDVHDVGQLTLTQPSKQYHAVYFTTDTNHVEVGFNRVRDNRTCRAIQFHSSPLCVPTCGPGDTTGFNQYDLVVHDNVIHGDVCDGINFATVNPAQGPVEAYNNVISSVGLGPDPPDGSSNYAGVYVPGITNSGPDGTGQVRVYNNTFYDCGARADTSSGAVARGPGAPGLTLQLTDNVVHALPGEAYVSADSTTATIAGSHNLWFGAGAGPGYLANNVGGDPLLAAPLAGDFHPRPGSPVLDAGIATSAVRDLDGVPRPSGAAFDLGAYETARPPKGDIDRDGSPDLVFRSNVNGAQNKVWFMNGVARASEAAIAPNAASADWRIRGVDDFSGDGQNDLVFWNQATGNVEFWLMNGSTRTGPALPLSGGPVLNPSWDLSATADFNHDGRPDLVWRNFTSQKIVVWTMDATGKLGSIIPTPDQAVDGNWIIVAALDYTNDGNTDLLWYNFSSGKIVTWYMNAAVVRTSGQFTSPSAAGDANWKVVASSDYSRNYVPGTPPLGSPDIVWRNETSGNQVVWHLDFASTRVHGQFTSPAANTPALAWTIVGPR